MKLLTIDFETFYSKEFSLSKMTTEAYIRAPEFEVIGMAYQWEDEDPVWLDDTLKIAAFFASVDWKHTALLAHNTMFDGAILHWHYGYTPAIYYDTLSMARPVTGATVGGSLKSLTERYLPGQAKGTEVVLAMGKRRGDFEREELRQYGEYCKNDVKLCYQLFWIFRKDFPPVELEVIDIMLRMYIDPVLELDVPKLREHLLAVQMRRDDFLTATGVSEASLQSSSAFANLLLQFGVEAPMKPSPTNPAKMTYAFSKTDEEFLELLDHPDERVAILVAARLGVKSTIERTRTETLIAAGERGKLAVPLNYYAAHTGRAGGSESINLQNLPSRGGKNVIRSAIRAPEGHTIVAGDSSNIEARILPWFACQWDLVDDFRNGVDAYCKFGSMVYGRTITKADKGERFVGKTCILGLGFGTGAAKLQRTLSLGIGGVPVKFTLQETKDIVDLYRNQYAQIRALWKDADTALMNMAMGGTYELGNGELTLSCTREGVHLPNGMMIRYPGLHKTEDGYVYNSRKAEVHIYGAKMVENIVQALARIVVFEQMVEVNKRLRPYDFHHRPDHRYRVVLTVHDENVLVVPTEAEPTAKKLLLQVMSTAPKWAQKLPVLAEVASGPTYGDCK